MNTVSVDKSLLTRVTQYVADRVFDFQQAETAPDGSIEIEAQEIIDSELKLLSELQAALTQPEQRTSARDIARAVGMPIQPEQPEAGRDLAAHIAEAIEKERFEIAIVDLYRKALEEVIRDALKVFRPQAQEAGRYGNFSFAYIAGMLDSYAACIHEYAPADDFARWHYVPEIQDAATWLRALRPQPQEANAEAVELLARLVAIANERPFAPLGHVLEHEVPAAKILVGNSAAAQEGL